MGYDVVVFLCIHVLCVCVCPPLFLYASRHCRKRILVLGQDYSFRCHNHLFEENYVRTQTRTNKQTIKQTIQQTNKQTKQANKQTTNKHTHEQKKHSLVPCDPYADYLPGAGNGWMQDFIPVR